MHIENSRFFLLTAAGLILSFASISCGSSPSGEASTNLDASADDGSTADIDGGADEAGGDDDSSADASLPPTVLPIFDHISQFGIYSSTDPVYTPPTGVVMWHHGTEFVTKLTPEQQAQMGSTLAARVTYHAQCDNYDRIGAIFFVLEPRGQAPVPEDPRTELVRFITPFSDYRLGKLATRVFPDADISAYASVLADTSKDVWIGIAGGSNPYDGDPCTNAAVTADFKAVGFKYSVDFVTKGTPSTGTTLTLTAASNVSATSAPVSGKFSNPGEAVTGHVTIIVSGHGSAQGGVEYESTADTVMLNGKTLGPFNTKIDCAPYAKYSPDGNPGIFGGNNTDNPRNWCPGALVPSHTFPATLTPGDNTISLGISPSAIPDGSYYLTSINFSAP